MSAFIRARRAPVAAAMLLAALVAIGQPAGAATKKKCSRDKAKVVRLAGNVQILTRTVKGRPQTDACWAKTGKRVRIAGAHSESDSSSTVEILGGRYVGVIEFIATGTDDETQARIYDATTGKLLHDSNTCWQGQPGDLNVTEAVFLRNGGMAVACDRLILFRTSVAAATQLEPAGANVRSLAASRDGRVVFWLAGPNAGEGKFSIVNQ